MSALRKAQFLYDNAEPEPDTGADEAERIWVDDGAEELLARRDVIFQRGFRKQGVTYEQFGAAVDEHLSEALATDQISPAALGMLYLAARSGVPSDCRTAAAAFIPDADEALREVARKLLRPLAKDGLLAQAEDEAS